MIAFHTLRENHDLTEDEYKRARDRIAQVQRTLDQSEDAEAAKTKEQVFHPANVWESLAARPGSQIPTDYHGINTLRMRAPFAGFHLPILDRLDRWRHYSGPDDATLRHIMAATDSNEVWERICAAIDPLSRMLPFAGIQQLVTLNIPPDYVVRTPKMFGEIGMLVDDVLCNADTILCQSRVNALYASGALAKIDRIIGRNGVCRILEIGSGHGALARAVMALFPGRIEYICCDLPSSLHFAAVYAGHFAADSKVVSRDDSSITHLRGRESCIFAPNYLIDAVVSDRQPIDVAINTMSMPEMSAEQVEFYCRLMVAALGKDGFFYEANSVLLAEHVDCKAIFSRHFKHRHTITHESIALGGETHEIWSMAPFAAEPPAETAPHRAPLADTAECMVFDALGRALSTCLEQMDGNLRRNILVEAGSHMMRAGLPSSVIVARLRALNW